MTTTLLINSTIKIAAAFLTAACFCYLFKAPKKDIFYCGLTGMFGWLALEVAKHGFNSSSPMQVFVATVTVTLLSVVFARKQKRIGTIYLVTGIIPYVPGGAIYNTMYNLVFHMPDEAAAAGVGAFLSAGSIALGVITVLSLYKLRKR